MMTNNNKVALIIGANGVLGSALIHELNQIGYITVGTTRQFGKTTIADYTLYASDLSQSSNEWLEFQLNNLLSDNGLNLAIIIELAGFGCADENLTPKRMKEMMAVNVFMPIYWAKAKQDVQHILFSSCAVYGTEGTKGLHFYSSTKRTVEKQMSRVCNHLSIVRPTIVATNFAERAGLPAFPTRGFPSAEQVARIVVKEAVVQNKTIVLPGLQAKLLHNFNFLSPRLAQFFLKV